MDRSDGAARPRRRGAPPVRLGLWLAAGLAGLTVVLAGLTLYMLLSPQSDLAARFPLSYVHEARAAHALQRPRDPAAQRTAEAETRAALASSPALASAWLRLAYLEILRHGALTPSGLEALERSYEVSPLGPDVSEARLRLVFGMWSAMPPDVRQQALAELSAAKFRDKPAAYRLAREVRDPAGRLAIGMGLAAIEMEAAHGLAR